MNKDWKAKKIEIAEICKEYPVLQERLDALAKSGYTAEYKYLKNITGLLSVNYLRKKKVLRIQVSYSELKKQYPAGWVIDLPAADFKETGMFDYSELPF
jgi:hypothetical protein